MKRISVFLIILLLAVTAPLVASAESQSGGRSLGGGRYEYVHPFSSDHIMNGLFSQEKEYFNLGNWGVHSVTLELAYALSPLLQNKTAELTLYINDEPFHSAILEKNDGSRGAVTFSVPVEALYNDSINAITIEIYSRSSADYCIDDATSANWVNFYKESKLMVEYTPQNQCNTIQEFYNCFTALESLDNGWSGIYLNPSPSEADLTLAANVAYGVSANAVLFYDNVDIGYVQSVNDIRKNRYAIYVSEYAGLNETVREALSPEQRRNAEETAVLALVKLGGADLLVLTGSDAASYEKLGKIISNQSLMPQLAGRTKQVMSDENYLSPAWDITQYIPLTNSGDYLRGVFEQNVVYYINYPASRQITASSEISLDFRYSENLDFDRSLVTVYINEHPIGSKKLSLEKAGDDHLLLNFPAENIHANGVFTVRISFNLEMGADWCRETPDEIPWAYVIKTSMLKLAMMDLPYADFANYPSPFLRDGRANGTLVLLPQDPGIEDLKAMHGVMLTLGRYAKDNRGRLQVASFGGAVDLTASNIIAIGQSSQNAILSENAKSFLFQFSENNETLLSNEQMSIETVYGKELGVGQMILSPYSDQVNMLLVVTGATPEAMLRAARMLSTESGLWKLQGDAFIVDAKGEYRTFLHNKDRSEYEMPVNKSGVTVQDMTTLIGVTLLLVLLFVLGLLLVVNKYRRPRHDED